MIMRTLSTKQIVVVFLLLIASSILLAVGKIENTAANMWVSPCRIENNLISDSIIHMEDGMYLAETGKAISILRSYDGCIWVEIESPVFDRDIGLYSAVLFRSPHNQLGIVWEKTGADPHEKPRSAFFWSIFDGATWSEPAFLFQRDEPCMLNDAIMLEDSALLLLWNEPLVHYSNSGDRIVRGSGCEVTYRAYIGKDELVTEQVIEPENPFSCYTVGYSFIDDGDSIWCVFAYHNNTDSLYRSRSEDGKRWTLPEPFHTPVSTCRDVFLTSKGEIGILEFNLGEKDLFLAKSIDWENWSKYKLFKSEKRIKRVIITEDSSGMMWGLLDTEGGLFFIHSPKGFAGEYNGVKPFVKLLYFLSIFCIIIASLFLSIHYWKKTRSKPV